MKQVHEGAVVRGRSGGVGNLVTNVAVIVDGVGDGHGVEVGIGAGGVVGVNGSWREGRQFGCREASICDRLKN